MAKRSVNTRIKEEVNRLWSVYSALDDVDKTVIDGLITQAARLRIRLDDLWEELQKNGETEWFTQSERTPPYERERPAARLFNATDKNYQTIIKMLDDKKPPPTMGESKLKAMQDE